jgi:hypothetical protein
MSFESYLKKKIFEERAKETRYRELTRSSGDKDEFFTEWLEARSRVETLQDCLTVYLLSISERGNV